MSKALVSKILLYNFGFIVLGLSLVFFKKDTAQ